jgi:hypothetical protein
VVWSRVVGVGVEERGRTARGPELERRERREPRSRWGPTVRQVHKERVPPARREAGDRTETRPREEAAREGRGQGGEAQERRGPNTRQVGRAPAGAPKVEPASGKQQSQQRIVFIIPRRQQSPAGPTAEGGMRATRSIS